MNTYIVTLESGKQFTVISVDGKSQVARSIEFERCMGKVVRVDLV